MVYGDSSLAGTIDDEMRRRLHPTGSQLSRRVYILFVRSTDPIAGPHSDFNNHLYRETRTAVHEAIFG